MKFSIFCLRTKEKKIPAAKLWVLFAGVLSFQFIAAQNTLPLTDLNYFQSPGPSWKLAGDVKGDIVQKGILSSSPGTGILVNFPDPKNPGKDIISNMQHGDMDLELDYMMAMGSNSEFICRAGMRFSCLTAGEL